MKSDTKVIDGFTYKMNQLGGLSGRAVALRLMRPVGAAFSAAASSGASKATWTSMLALGAGAALEHLSEEDLVFVCDKFMEQTQVGIPDAMGRVFFQALGNVFDEHFAGRYDAMIEWLRWGITLNRFFAGALERMAAARAAEQAKTTAASPSPTVSTDGSGDSTAPAA